MRRRRRLNSDHEDSARWLVSYADLVTLLFAFFVVMYAVSSVNDAKYRVVSDSMQGAFGKLPPNEVTVKKPPPVNPAHPLAALQMQGVVDDLNTVLAPRLPGGQIRLREDAVGIHIEINSRMLFAAGDAHLVGDADAILRAIADALRGEPYDIEIAGHTDNLPIANSRFASNWELSAMRATAVVRVLADAGIAGPRLKAVGRAESLPVSSNLSAEGRARNRRVELTVLAKLPPAAR